MFGIIRGVVKDSKTRKIISHAKLICPRPGVARPASTPSSGVYVVIGPYGEYTIKASASGYYPRSKKVTIGPANPLDPQKRPVVRIALKRR